MPVPTRMYLLALLCCLALVSCSIEIGPGAAADIEPKIPDPGDAENAGAVAEQFLALLDNGSYAESWSLHAKVIEGDLNQDKWTALTSGLRGVAGTLEVRSLQSSVYTEALPEVGAGQFFLRDYLTRFSNVQAGERVVLAKQEEEWRIAGYFMQTTVRGNL